MNPSNLIDRVSNNLRKQQVTSPQRRRYLEQLAQMLSRDYNPSVNFCAIDTARVRHEDGEMEIDIGVKICPQEVTNMDPEIWRLIAQEGYLIHEIGHVLYTDFEAHEEIKEDLGMKEMNAFHDTVWNPAEDAAIEEQLRQSFNVSREIDTLKANLFAGQKKRANGLSIPKAVKIAILEKGSYDAGALDEHLRGERDLVAPRDREVFDDTIVPEINRMLADVMTEPDPKTRYERMLGFWNFLKDVMRDELDYNASDQAKRGGDGYEGMPDDTSGMTPGEAAEKLEDMDEDEVREQLRRTAQPRPEHDWDDILDEDDEGEEGGEGQETEGEEADDGDETPEQETGDGDEEGDGEDEQAGGGAPGEDEQGEEEDGEGGDEQGDDEKGANDGAEETDGDGDEQGGEDEDGDQGDGQGGQGGQETGDGGDDFPFPGHEDHHLVLRD